MGDETTIKCTKCGQSTFHFNMGLIELRGEVACECAACNAVVRVRLDQDEVRIIAQQTPTRSHAQAMVVLPL